MGRTSQPCHPSPTIPSQKQEPTRIRLLGGFRVSVGARSIGENAWPLKKAQSLIKILALAPGHRLHREQVMDLLWPNLTEKAATNNLRRTLHAARRALNPNPATGSRLLASSKDMLVLCPEGGLWVDTGAFEETANAAWRTEEPAAYRAALDLYAGELLPEDRYEEWAEGPRMRLRSTYLSLLAELASLLERRGDLGSATELFGKLLAEEPMSEGVHASLMRIYALGGRRGEALSQYERLKNILSSHLGAEPSASVRALREEIASGRYPPRDVLRDPGSQDEGSPRHNLTCSRTSFVGRERELLAVKRELASTRLLTLTGTGGTGKTRLAMEIGRDLAGAYRDGAWMVELAPLSQGELVSQEAASVLGVREQPGATIEEALARYLRDRQALLLLDNCEHLLDSCARLADLLLASCPDLRILVTSREPLGVEDEVVWRVPPLPVPQRSSPAEELTEYAAVRLFVERARQKLPAFALVEGNAHAVCEVCRGLEGVPLAVELAAARMGAMAAEHLAQRLDDTLDLLSSGPRTAFPRQRTMRMTLEWSHGLLAEKERIAFRGLSVFAGGFSLETAEAVLPGEGIAEGEILGLISALVEKSLLLAELVPGSGIPPSGGPRYRMLEPIRQYAREKLEESGRAGEVRSRHAHFFLKLAEEAEPQLRGTQQKAWLERLEREHDNLRVALSWALESGEGDLGLRLSGALGDFWHACGYLGEGRGWLEECLAKGDASPAPARVKALAHAGYLAWEQVDYEKASTLSEECLALSRELGDGAWSAAACYVSGAVEMFQKNFEEATKLFEEALPLWREEGNEASVARTLQGLGLVAVARHDYGRAMQIHDESLTLARKAGDNLGMILALGQGALAAVGRGEHDLAGHLCAEGLELAQRAGHPHAIMFLLNVRAVLAAAQGQPARSARMWGTAAALGQTIGIHGLAPVEQYHYGPYINAVRAELGQTAWEAAWAEGRAMMTQEAIEFALSDEEPPDLPTPPVPERPPTDRPASELTRREREVALLVGRGMTNRCIASELVLSTRTVETHVRNVLKKLRLGSRTQLAAWIAERRPLDDVG